MAGSIEMTRARDMANLGNGYFPSFLDGGSKTSQFTPTIATKYTVDCSSAGVTVNLSGMTTPQVGQGIVLNKIGNNPMCLLGTANGITNILITTPSCETYIYGGASWGFN